MTSATLPAIAKQAHFMYSGEHGDWRICLSVHRDSDTLDQSNFDAMRRALESAGEQNVDWTIEHCGHWAVGWINHLTVRPDSACEAAALAMLARLDDYPVLDEDDWSARENDAILDTLADCIYDHMRHDVPYGPMLQRADECTDIADRFMSITSRELTEDRCWLTLKRDEPGNDRDDLAQALRLWRAALRATR
jgi:hypothetical protein